MQPSVIAFVDCGDGVVRLSGTLYGSAACVAKVIAVAPAHLRPHAITYVTDDHMFQSRPTVRAVIAFRPDGAVVLEQADPVRPDLPLDGFSYRLSS